MHSFTQTKMRSAVILVLGIVLVLLLLLVLLSSLSSTGVKTVSGGACAQKETAVVSLSDALISVTQDNQAVSAEIANGTDNHPLLKNNPALTPNQVLAQLETRRSDLKGQKTAAEATLAACKQQTSL